MKVHRWTLDVLVVVTLTLLADIVVLVPDLGWTPVRVAVLLVLFLPAYVLVGVLYPKGPRNGSRPDPEETASSGDRGLYGCLRTAFHRYGDDAPADPTAENASLHAHPRVTVGDV